MFELLLRFRKGIVIALSLVLIENISWIVEPAVFGAVIDALIERASASQGVQHAATLFPLALWIGLYLLNSGTGALRRVVDQRIFLRMFTDVATDVAELGVRKDYPVSKTAALAQLSQEYITFFQYRMPEILEQSIAIGGAVIAMAAFDWRIALACLTVVLPLVLIGRLYNRRVSVLQRQFHDLLEDTFDVFASRDPEEVRRYYTRSAEPRRLIAKWGAVNFGVMRLSLLAIFIVVLYIAIDLDEFSTGQIYSIVAYQWTFVTSSEYLPELMESWTSLKDISQRIRTA